MHSPSLLTLLITYTLFQLSTHFINYYSLFQLILTNLHIICLPIETIVVTIINGIFKWYALHQILVRGSLRILFIILITLDTQYGNYDLKRSWEISGQIQSGYFITNAYSYILLLITASKCIK